MQTESKPKQVKAPTLKEACQTKKITVHISNKTDKKKIKMLSTKDLVEALQTKTKSIQEMSCLISGNIKIYAESLEAKKVLHK